MTTHKPDLLRPALIGGLIGFAMTVVPPLCCLNLCCCLNYIVAGAIAGGMYARRAAPIGWFPGVGEGASTGAVAGFVAGTLHGIVGAIGLTFFSLLNHGGRHFGEWARATSEFPFGQRDPFDIVWTVPPFALGFVHLATSVVTGVVAGLVGGMIGVSLFRVPPVMAPASAGPSAPIDVTPRGDDPSI